MVVWFLRLPNTGGVECRFKGDSTLPAVLLFMQRPFITGFPRVMEVKSFILVIWCGDCLVSIFLRWSMGMDENGCDLVACF